jgi:nucleotide-binding universal stress UspA family protein
MTTGHGPRPVVVGVDGSTGSTRAVRWAATQAAVWRSPLRLVHAHLWPWIYRPEIAGMAGDYEQALRDTAYDWLRQAADAAAATAPEIEIDTELITSAAAPLLITESARARLIVVGSRGLGGFTGLVLGSTAVTLAAHGHCPVAVVRVRGEEPTPAHGPVVLGVDGTESGEAAIGFAFDAASVRGAELVAVHAWSDVSVPASFVPAPPTFDWPVMEGDERRLLAQRLAGWQEKYPDVLVRQVITEGRPAHSLLTAADGAQLVVVGSRGRGGLRGLVLGSTSQALLHHAPCPVVVARP